MLITLARKPFDAGSTVVLNVLQHGCGALNIGASRIAVAQDDPNKRRATGAPGGADSPFGVGNSKRPATLEGTGVRWPANLVLCGGSAKALDDQSGGRRSAMTGRAPPDGAYANTGRSDPKVSMFRGIGGGTGVVYADTGGASRFFKQVGVNPC